MQNFINFLGYTPKQFWVIVDRFWNREIFDKVNGLWILKESIHKDLINKEGENV